MEFVVCYISYLYPGVLPVIMDILWKWSFLSCLKHHIPLSCIIVLESVPGMGLAVRDIPRPLFRGYLRH
jgi:hypothetical protein